MSEKRKKGFQSNFVYEELKRRIISVEMKPGDSIDEKKLLSELAVGRTPFREAILRLKNDDLIVSSPNKSAYVKEITLKDVRDISEALIGIERLTTSLATQRISLEAIEEIKKTEKKIENAVVEKNYGAIVFQNREFHNLIAKASDNKYIIAVHENLRNQTSRLSYLALSKDFGNNAKLDQHHQSIINQHQKIISLLEKRDADQAGNVAFEHIRLFQNRVMLYIDQMFN